MKKINIFLVTGVILIIVLLSILVVEFKNKKIEERMGSVPTGEQTIFSSTPSNSASVSFTADDDIILYHGNPTASVSVGDRLQITGAADITDGYNYFVKTVSTSAGFEIASVSEGTVLNLIADSLGGETFYQIPVGGKIDVSQSKYHTISMIGEELPTGTLRVVGAISDFKPDFLTSPSASNMYEYLDVNDVQSQTSIDGDTGIAFSGTSDYRMVRIYNETLKWVSVVFESLTSGSYSVKIDSSD